MKKLVAILAIMLIVFTVNVTPIVSFADDGGAFVPSIEQKPIPEVETKEAVVITETDGEKHIEVFQLEVDIDMLLTAYADVVDEEKSQSIPEMIKVTLIEAHDDLKDIDSKEEYETLGIDFDELAKRINPDYDSSVFVVSYLFDITINDVYKEWLAEDEDHYCRVRFKLNLNKNNPKPAIMHKPEDSDKWLLLDDEFVEIDEDGALVAYFKSFCPVAFIEVSEQRVEELYIRRQQKHSYWWILLLLIFICILLVFYIYLIYTDKKKNNNNNKDSGNSEKSNQ